MTSDLYRGHTTRDQLSAQIGSASEMYAILTNRSHPNTASNSAPCTMTDRWRPRAASGRFAIHGTVTPNPNRNRFSGESPTIWVRCEKNEPKHYYWTGKITWSSKVITLTGIFFNEHGTLSTRSGTLVSLLLLLPAPLPLPPLTFAPLISAMKFSKSLIKKSFSISSWFWFVGKHVLNETFSSLRWIGPLFRCDRL